MRTREIPPMPSPTGRTYGRAAMLGVLLALLLTISAAVYAYVARYGTESLPASLGGGDPVAEVRRLNRLTILLAILLISALLLLLFVVGSYLVIRIGHIIRTPVGGKPTPYVDAWQSYRVTEEEIAAATAEDTPERPPGDDSAPPADAGPDDGPPES